MKCTVNRHCRQKKKSRDYLTKLDVKQCQTRFTLHKHVVHQQTSCTEELSRDSFASHLENKWTTGQHMHESFSAVAQREAYEEFSKETATTHPSITSSQNKTSLNM